MTVINFSGLEDTLGLYEPLSGGKIEATRWNSRGAAVTISSPHVIFPNLLSAKISDGAPDRVIDIAPTDGTFCVKWDITGFVYLGARKNSITITRYTLIPSSGPVNFADLEDVNPTTLVADATSALAWESAVRDAYKTIQNALSEIPGKVSEEVEVQVAPEVQRVIAETDIPSIVVQAVENQDIPGQVATQVQTQIDPKITVIEGIRDDAAGSASNAAISASSAESSALRAESAAGTVDGVVEAAENARDAAGGHAASASGSATTATQARIDAQAASQSASDSADLSVAASEDSEQAKTLAQSAAQSAEASKTSASTSATNAGLSASDAEASKDQAEVYKSNAEGFAGGAASSATSAAASALAASGHEDDARAYSESASGSATSAGNSATAAETSKTAAETARTGAESARDLALAGQFAGSPLGATSDLNTITTPGVYRVSNSTYPSLALNYPQAAPATGILEVFSPSNSSANVVQRWTTQTGANSAKGFYERRLTGGAWSTWAFTTSQRIVRTAGIPDVGVFTWDDTTNAEVGIMPTDILIPTAQNLNDIKASGNYRQPVTISSGLSLNYPINNALGSLRVTSTANTITQEFLQTSGTGGARVVYIRRYIVSTTSWSAWYAVTTQRVDQTAGRAIYTWDDLNSREQLIYGDTGWRNIYTSLYVPEEWTASSSSSYLIIRREGTTVTLSARLTSARQVNSGATLLVMFNGFKPQNTLTPGTVPFSMGPTASPTGVGHVRAYPISGGQLDFRTPVPSGTEICLDLSWPTIDPWPTTLPGTAVGTIPNL